jgi:glycyl-tRNA synthetase beta chain
MRQNQKYFPLFDRKEKILPRFLIVSNMKVADARHIIGGNEKVVRPRLEDARFFYNQDRKTRLEERVPQLAKVVYHNKLGSQLERVQRIQLSAGRISRHLKADVAAAERAAWLSKADLLTGMVGEFPELQGVMGGYYALHDGEKAEVAKAIAEHYKPRYAGDALPEGAIGCALALADKLDALTGMFSIGQQPTGEKDPFGLRRAALAGAPSGPSEADQLRAALDRVAEQQPKTIDRLRANGIVFDGPLGTDPDNWEHVAFAIYSDLCEMASIARAALAGVQADRFRVSCQVL